MKRLNRRSTITIEHDAGTTVLKTAPKRIVALDEYALKTMIVLGMKPVGYVTSNQPSLEAITAPHTNLIVVNTSDSTKPHSWRSTLHCTTQGFKQTHVERHQSGHQVL
jgi:ABC-type Fe3+-citrate transport system substrate-binding protein